MARLRREAAHLRERGRSSLLLAMELFNRPANTARIEGVLIFSQHALEMLLKAVIFQKTGKIRAEGERYTYTFEKCVRIAHSDLQLVTAEEAVSLRALDGHRDAAMHHLIHLSEDMLYIRTQSAVTLFRELLHRAFGEDLTQLVPPRALPVATIPPRDLVDVVQREVDAIRELLRPGKRQVLDAQARLRGLLDLEAAAGGRVDPPDQTEMSRAVKAMREGVSWQRVFPGVASLQVQVSGDGAIPVAVKLTRGEGSPVRLAKAGEEALLYREVNPLDRWSVTFDQLKRASGLGQWRLRAVLEHLGLVSEPDVHEHRLGSVKQKRWTPAAKDRLLKELPTLGRREGLPELHAKHRIGRGARTSSGTSSSQS
jgi:hypothetical protein